MRRSEVAVRLGTENLVARSTQPDFRSCRSGSHLFKLIRRFLFGTFPFFLQFSTAHPSAARGFSENSTTRFPFLFFSGATPLFPRMVNWGGRRIDSLVLGERYFHRRVPRHKKSARCRRQHSRAFGPDNREPVRLSVEPRWAW